MKINNWYVDVVDKKYEDEFYEEMLEELMSNHMFNMNTDWERVRGRNKWKRTS